MKVVLAWTDSRMWQRTCDTDVKGGTVACVSQELNYFVAGPYKESPNMETIYMGVSTWKP